MKQFIYLTSRIINKLHITTNLYKINNSYYLEKKNDKLCMIPTQMKQQND